MTGRKKALAARTPAQLADPASQRAVKEQELVLAELRELAAEVSTDFGIDTPVLTCLAHAHNTTFRVDGVVAGRRRSFSLRLYRSGVGTLERVKSEVLILSHLRACGVRAPGPVWDGSGRAVRRTRKGEHTGSRSALLCDWVEGETPEQTAFRAMPRRLAREIAHVHEALAELSRRGPHGTALTRPHWDARGLRGSVVGADPTLANALASPHELLLLREARSVAEAALARLARTGTGVSLIHADPRRENILVGPGGITFIDFEGCGWGQPAYDLAVLLSDALRDAPDLDTREFMDALVDGYREVRELSAAEYDAIGALVAGRLAVHLTWYLCSTVDPAFPQDGDFKQLQAELLSQTLRPRPTKVFNAGRRTHEQQ